MFSAWLLKEGVGIFSSFSLKNRPTQCTCKIVYSRYEYHTATAIPHSKAVVQYYLLLLSEQEQLISVQVAVGTANQSKQECLSDMEYRDHLRDLTL